MVMMVVMMVVMVMMTVMVVMMVMMMVVMMLVPTHMGLLGRLNQFTFTAHTEIKNLQLSLHLSKGERSGSRAEQGLGWGGRIEGWPTQKRAGGSNL